MGFRVGRCEGRRKVGLGWDGERGGRKVGMSGWEGVRKRVVLRSDTSGGENINIRRL